MLRNALVLSSLLLVAGCSSEQAVLLPNFDPTIDKTVTTLKFEASQCFPYPADAQRGPELPMRAEIGYSLNQINLIQFSGQDWDNVELWVNKSYVLKLDRLESRELKRISFKLIYDQSGNHFPLDNNATRIEMLELKKDGVMHAVAKQLG